MASASSCTCLTKTPQLSYHLPMCRYRLPAEALARINDLEEALTFYRDAWTTAGEDGECGRVPSWRMCRDEGAMAVDLLSRPSIGYTGWTCPTCGPVPPHEVTQDQTHDDRYGGCGARLSL